MFDDLDWYRDLEWFRRLDEDLSYIVESVALDELREAQDRLLSLHAWAGASTDVRTSDPVLADRLNTALADWRVSRPRAITSLVELTRLVRMQVHQLQEEQLADWPPVPHTVQTIDGPFWAPVSVGLRLRFLLAVENPTGQPMSAQLHRELMAEKVARLFEHAGDNEARDALEMSLEDSPELWTISKSGLPKEWPTMVMQSDSMALTLGFIDWDEEFRLGIPEDHPSQEGIRESLDEATLWHLLECL